MDAQDRKEERQIQPEAQTVPSSQPAQDMEAHRAAMEEAKRERGQFKELLQRVQADFVNFKRRAEEERQEQGKQANADLILKLLPVLDDSERALDRAPASGEEARWLEGVALIYRGLRSVLEAHGLSTIQAQNQRFDPWEHEALFYEETSEVPEGQVLRVIRDGYKLHDRVLRPAQVSIARSRAGQPETDEGTTSEEKKEA